MLIFLQWKDTFVTYEHYYMVKHNQVISDRNQCLLVSKPTERDKRKGYDTDVVLVPEFCFLTGLSDEQRSDFRLMSVSLRLLRHCCALLEGTS